MNVPLLDVVVGVNKQAATGKLIRHDELRGYGFIAPDHGSDDIFVHVNDLDMDRESFVPGARLEFLVDEGDRGLRASRVRLAQSEGQLIQALHQALNDGGQEAAEAGNNDAAPTPLRAVSKDKGAPDADDVDLDAHLYDVLSQSELEEVLTESLLQAAPELTGKQILAVRGAVVAIAREYNWIED